MSKKCGNELGALEGRERARHPRGAASCTLQVPRVTEDHRVEEKGLQECGPWEVLEDEGG